MSRIRTVLLILGVISVLGILVYYRSALTVTDVKTRFLPNYSDRYQPKGKKDEDRKKEEDAVDPDVAEMIQGKAKVRSPWQQGVVGNHGNIDTIQKKAEKLAVNSIEKSKKQGDGLKYVQETASDQNELIYSQKEKNLEERQKQDRQDDKQVASPDRDKTDILSQKLKKLRTKKERLKQRELKLRDEKLRRKHQKESQDVQSKAIKRKTEEIQKHLETRKEALKRRGQIEQELREKRKKAQEAQRQQLQEEKRKEIEDARKQVAHAEEVRRKMEKAERERKQQEQERRRRQEELKKRQEAARQQAELKRQQEERRRQDAAARSASGGKWLGLDSANVPRRFPGITFLPSYRPSRPFVDPSDPNARGMEQHPQSIGDMTPSQAEERYYQLVTTDQVACNPVKRMGNQAEGGWDMCVAEPFLPGKDCIVYSFGIANDWSFDEMISRTYGCKVRAFDPTIGLEDHQHSQKIAFYNMGLAENNYVTRQGWNMKTLGSIFKEIGDSNKIIDYLKVDIEYSEWKALEAMYFEGSLKNVKQFVFEIHTPEVVVNGANRPSKKEDFNHMYDILLRLEKLGFRRYHSHANPMGMYTSVRTGVSRTCCHEVYYINLNFMK